MENYTTKYKSEIDIYVKWIQNCADEFSRLGNSINDTQIQVSETELIGVLERLRATQEMIDNDLNPKKYSSCIPK